MDSDGMNELLAVHRLAKGATILISNGKVAVPYDDGEPMSKEHELSLNKEMRDEMVEKKLLIVHSNKVLQKQVDSIDEQLSELNVDAVAPGTKEAYDKTKDIKDRIKVLENQKDQTSNQILQNDAEISRLQTNIEVFEETISDLLS